jgi:hypothetical protein
MITLAASGASEGSRWSSPRDQSWIIALLMKLETASASDFLLFAYFLQISRQVTLRSNITFRLAI